MLWLISLLACSPEFMDLEDSSDSFTPVTGFFGGPYVIFFNIEIDCKETYWVDKLYRNGEAPYDRDLEALQITFNDSDDVVTGNYSTGGEAPVRISFLNIAGEAFEFENASDGSTINTTAVDDEWTAGTLNLTFLEKTITGDYNVPFCVNLIH